MGCFDTIIIKCPNCDTEIECQSKSGDCCLKRISLNKAVRTNDPALSDINRHAPFVCSNCGEKWRVQISFDATVVPDEEYIEQEDDDWEDFDI